MGRFAIAALVAGGLLAASVSTAQATTVGIDFGCGEPINGAGDCVSGDAPLQSGYEGWTGPYTNSGINYDVTRSFSSDFGDSGIFDLTITSNELYFRDYATLTGTFASQSDLLSDSLLRNTAGSIVFEFSGLTAGTYSMESFHHDTVFGNSTVPFTIEVMDALGTNTLLSTFDTSDGTSPTAITTALYTFIVGEAGTASITFSTTAASPGNHMSINGFQLSDVPPVPLPAGVWLLLSALGGLGVAGWRRKRVETA